VLWAIAGIAHEADVGDERYDAPKAPGLDVVLRGLTMVLSDEDVLALTARRCDGGGDPTAPGPPSSSSVAAAR